MKRTFLCIAVTTMLVAASSPENQDIPEYGTGQCSPVKIKYLIGRSATRVRVKAAFDASNAKTLRKSRVGQAVTQDYRTDRLNIVTDGRNIIRRITCG